MEKALVILQGKTFAQTVRWEATPYVYKPISAVTQGAPCRITATGHGIPNGWRVAVVSVKGMTQLNAENIPPRDRDYTPATVIDANTVELNEVNSSGYKAYTSGGYLQFYTPVDLSGYTARMSIKDKVGGTELLALTTANSRITLDTVAKKINLLISATDTAALTWSRGVYELEMESPTGVVTTLLSGSVSVTKEIAA